MRANETAGPSGDVKNKVNSRLTIGIMVAVFIATQLFITITAAEFSWEAWTESMALWDSAWYIRIANLGYYSERSMAFYPLWPLIIGGIGKITAFSSVQVIGFLLSVGFYLAAIWLLSPKGPPHYDGEWPLIRARHSLQLLPVIFAPGAWVYASNHTEALFLFLTVLAFQQAYKGELVVASIVVGIAALTRNQGVIAAAAIGVYFLLNTTKLKRPGWQQFALSGLISGAIFALWPLYQYTHMGDPFGNIAAQRYWGPSATLPQYIENMLWVSDTSVPRMLWFWLMLGTSITLMLRRKDRAKTLPIGLYLLLSVVIWPMQGFKVPNGFRYGAVLFPFWLLVGHYLTGLLFSASAGWRGACKRVLGFSLAGYMMAAMVIVTCHYFFKGTWAY